MQGKVILTNEEILKAVNHYHSDKEATQQRTAIQNANPKKWIKYLTLQTFENQKLLMETKKYLDSLVSEKSKVLKYLEINKASESVITRISKLLNYDVEVAYKIVESAHRRAISESGATELVDSQSSFYEKHIGIRPRIKAFLDYLADSVPLVYNLNSDKLRKPLAEYVRNEERINLEYLGIYKDNTKPQAEGTKAVVRTEKPQWKARALFMFYRQKFDETFSYQNTLAYFECQDSSGKSNYNQLHKAFLEIERIGDRCLSTNRQHIFTAIQELEKLESCKKSLEIALAEYNDFNVKYPIN